MCCERLATTAAAGATRLGRLLLAVLDGHEVDFAFLDVDAGEAHFQRLGQPVFAPGAFAFQDGPRRVLVVVVARSAVTYTGPSDSTSGKRATNRRAPPCDRDLERFAHPLLQMDALQPFGRLARRFVGATFGAGAVLTQLLHLREA